MKKDSKSKSPIAAGQDGQGTTDLISKVQLQLSIIEKKLDILINQPAKRPFEKSYSQNPPRRFDHSNRHDRGRGDNYPRERTFTRVVCSDCNKECEIPFKPSGDRPVYCKECFSKRRQGSPFTANRDNRPQEKDFPRERSFDRKQAKIGQKPFKRKKPSSARKKKRA